MSEFAPDDGRIDVLIIDLAEKAIQSFGDVYRLCDEVETLQEDFPGYFVIFALPRPR